MSLSSGGGAVNAPYEASVVREFLTKRSIAAMEAALPVDYAAVAATCGAAPNANAVVDFRISSINWMAHFLQSGKFSLSTANLFSELFDRHLSACASRPPVSRRDSLARVLRDDACMVTFVLVLAKLCIAYNEDKSLRVSTADVLRYLPPGAARKPDRGEFRRTTMDVLDSIGYSFWPAESPKRAFEALLKRLLDARFRVRGRADALTRLALPIYCRYLYDVVHADYALLRCATESSLIGAALYLAVLHWPSNYAACASAREETGVPAPAFPHARDLAADPRVVDWCRGVRDAMFGPSGADMNAATERALRRLELDTRGTFYAGSKLVERYSMEEAGRVSRVGFPSLEFFRVHKLLFGS